MLTQELAQEFNFTLPRGLVDDAGQIHRQGLMRLATAKDELAVAKHRRSHHSETDRTLVLLARVVTQLGTLNPITPEHLENLFTNDLGYLREFYNRINQHSTAEIPARCPACDHAFALDLALAGE